MKPEKVVKLQARKKLGNNNWSTAIGCFAITLMFAFLILFLYYCLVYGLGLVDITTGEIKNNKIYINNEEINDYVLSKEWVGCAGYKIEGSLSGFVRKIIGSYSGVVGLPLYETRNLLNGAGIK